MKTLIFLAVVAGALVWLASWAGSKFDEDDFESELPWQDDGSI